MINLDISPEAVWEIIADGGKVCSYSGCQLPAHWQMRCPGCFYVRYRHDFDGTKDCHESYPLAEILRCELCNCEADRDRWLVLYELI